MLDEGCVRPATKTDDAGHPVARTSPRQRSGRKVGPDGSLRHGTRARPAACQELGCVTHDGAVCGDMRAIDACWLVPLTLVVGGDSTWLSPPRPTHVHFEEVTAAAGFDHYAPTYDAVIADFDGDGWPDAYVGNHGTDNDARLLHNQGDGRFRDTATASGIDLGGDQHGGGAADYDNDGDVDLLVSLGAARGLATKVNRLYRNDGGLRFSDIGAESGAADPRGRSRSVAWLDFDRDGALDLILGNYESPAWLLFGTGDGRFRDRGTELGLEGDATVLAWSDVDEDGDPDLALATSRGLRLLRNDGTALVDITDDSGLRSVSAPVKSLAFGDLDGDGHVDLYLGHGAAFDDGVTHREGEVRFAFFAAGERKGIDFALPAGNPARLALYRNGHLVTASWIHCGAGPIDDASECPADVAASGPGEREKAGFLVWRERGDRDPVRWHLRWTGSDDHHLSGRLPGATDPKPVALGTPAPRGGTILWGRGDGRFDLDDPPGLQHEANAQSVALADVDNDGRLDLYVVDSGQDGAGGTNLLFVNRGDRRFARAGPSAGVGPDSGDGRPAAAHFFDYDRDGRLDLLLLNGWGAPPFDRGPYRLLRNRSEAGHWIRLALRGHASNRQGLGTWIEVVACGRTQRRYHAGSRGPYSQSALPPHFGLGYCRRVDRLTLEWPSGRRQELTGLAVDQLHSIEEPR